MKKLIDHIFICRPMILIPVWGFFIAGWLKGQALSNSNIIKTFHLFGIEFNFSFGFDNITPLITLFFFSLLLSSIYIINQLADLKSDLENRGLPLIAKAKISFKAATIQSILFILAPLLYAFFLDVKIFILFLSSFVLGIIYSLKPFYFTGRPFLDFLSNALGYGFIAFAIGVYSTSHNFEFSKIVYLSIPYFLVMAAGSISSTIPDMEGDIKGGKLTTPIFIGAKASNILAIIILIISFYFAIIQKDAIVLITAIISFPFYIKYQLSGNSKDSIITTQVGGGGMMLIIALLFPKFLISGILTFILTKIYFKIRHNINYPELGS